MGHRLTGRHPAAGLLRWACRAAVAVTVVSTLTFAMVQALPGDAAATVAAARYDAERVTPDMVDAVRQELGLDAPAWKQLLHWYWAAISLSPGRSAVTGEPVGAMLQGPAARTVTLVATAWPGLLLAGLVGGAALGRSRRGLALANLLGAAAAGTPSYALGLALGSAFAIGLGWLPVAGYGHPSHLVLPALTLVLLGGARLSLITARAVDAAMSHPSIAFARMKAVGPVRLTLGHVVPLAAPPVIAYAFIGLAFLLEGAAVVETVFAYPGLGLLLVEAARARDVPVIQAVATMIAIAIVTANTLADALAGALQRTLRAG